jgi:hypothetical protein
MPAKPQVFPNCKDNISCVTSQDRNLRSAVASSASFGLCLRVSALVSVTLRTGYVLITESLYNDGKDNMGNRQTGRLTAGRNITLTLTFTMLSRNDLKCYSFLLRESIQHTVA